MNYSKQLIPLVVVAIGLAGCGGSGGSSGMTSGSPAPTGSAPPEPTVTPPVPQTADFTQVVKEQVAATSETSEPIEINDTKFVFHDDDNPAAFDDVLPKVE